MHGQSPRKNGRPGYYTLRRMHFSQSQAYIAKHLHQLGASWVTTKCELCDLTQGRRPGQVAGLISIYTHVSLNSGHLLYSCLETRYVHLPFLATL